MPACFGAASHTIAVATAAISDHVPHEGNRGNQPRAIA